MSTICPSSHAHALKTTCYVKHSCRCTPCGEAWKQRGIDRRKRATARLFTPGLVDAAPVREHLRTLNSYGLGYERIAKLAGVRVWTVRTLLAGRRSAPPGDHVPLWVVPQYEADRILALQPHHALLADAALMPAVGTHRRVQALVYQGWSLAKIAHELGIKPQSLSAMLNQAEVRADTYRQVVSLYDALWDVPPPQRTPSERGAVSRARNHAVSRGWASPLAWDDIDTDAEPEGLVEYPGVKDAA